MFTNIYRLQLTIKLLSNVNMKSNIKLYSENFKSVTDFMNLCQLEKKNTNENVLSQNQ